MRRSARSFALRIPKKKNIVHVTGATRASKKRSTRATSVRRHHHCLKANRGMCDHALPGMCEHALPTWSEVIRDPSDFKEETLLHVLADDVILKIDTIPLPAFRTFKVVYPKYPCTTIVRKVPDGKLSMRWHYLQNSFTHFTIKKARNR